MAKALAVLVSGAVAGGVLDITYEDCGDANTHGKVSDLQPTTVTIGSDNSLVGTGTVDEDISQGSFVMKVTAGGGLVKKTYTGDVCEPKEFTLPLSMGTMKWGGLSCPVVAGTMSIPVSVSLSSSIPASLATADVAVTGIGADSSDNLLCMNLHMKKQYAKGFVRMPRNEEIPVAEITDEMRAAAPSSLDWTTKGATTPVKDQGQCGSCWAYSATEGIESGLFMSTGTLEALSEQQVISCDKTDGGCNGGDLPTAFSYVTSAGGIDSQSDYPDSSNQRGKTGSCKWDGQKAASLATYKYAVSPCTGGSCSNQDESGMMAALDNYGPLSVCVNAASWNGYYGGIMSSSCSGGYSDLDHCVQLVGYDNSGSQPYWKVRNSWGSSWGENGYIRLAMGKNLCGIADEAMYVTAKLDSADVVA